MAHTQHKKSRVTSVNHYTSTSPKHTTQEAKEIAAITQSLNNPIYSVYSTTVKNYHRGYDFNSRQNKESGVRWDCSELASALVKQQITDMKNASSIKWKTDLSSLEHCFPQGSTTLGQRAAMDKLGIEKVAHGSRNSVKNTELKPGMMIYLAYPQTKSGYSRHVATVTRNPQTGELMISESIGGKNNIGVVHRSVNDFFNKGKAINNPKTTVTVYDPFYKDRKQLDQLDKEASQIRVLYKEANQAYKNGGGNFHKVGGNEKNGRMNFIENYIKNKMHNNGVILENDNTNNTLVADNSNRFTKEQVNVFNANQIGKFNNTFLSKLDFAFNVKSHELESTSTPNVNNKITLT